MEGTMDDQYGEWTSDTMPSLLNTFVHSLNGSVTVSLLFPSSFVIPQSTPSVSLITTSEITSSEVNDTAESLTHLVVNNLLTGNNVLTTDDIIDFVSNIANSTRPLVNMSRISSTDETGPGERVPLSIEILMYIMYISVIIAALGGNGVVSFLILQYPKMRTVTNFFILNLAIGDILMACLCIPFTFVANLLVQSWIFGETMCILVSYSQAVSVFLSAYTLVAISIDRYIAILYPLRPRMTKFQAKLIIGVIWLVSLATPLPTAFFSQLEHPDPADMSKIVCNESWSQAEHRYYYSMLLMILQYVFPLTVLVFTYTRIALVVWGKQTPGEAEDGRDQRLAASKRKMVKMMITCVTVFTLCWLPLNALLVIGDQYPDIYQFSYILYIWFACHFLAMSHACYNPIIYIWMNSRFREGFKYISSKILPCVIVDVNIPDFLRPPVITQTHNFAHSTVHPNAHMAGAQGNNNSYRGSSSTFVSPCVNSRSHLHINNHDNDHRKSECIVISVPDDDDRLSDRKQSTSSLNCAPHPSFAKMSIKKGQTSQGSCAANADASDRHNTTACVSEVSHFNCNQSAHQTYHSTSLPPSSVSTHASSCCQEAVSETTFSIDNFNTCSDYRRCHKQSSTDVLCKETKLQQRESNMSLINSTQVDSDCPSESRGNMSHDVSIREVDKCNADSSFCSSNNNYSPSPSSHLLGENSSPHSIELSPLKCTTTTAESK